MTHDTNRVKSFQNAIRGAIEMNKCLNWLEIGPGADAVLSNIVL
jgi:hypothetical protein